MNSQPHGNKSGQARKPAVHTPHLNRLPAIGKRRLLRGLERFVNVGDGEESYQDLKKAWPSFWPVSLVDRDTGHDLNWHTEAHALLLVYRDTLRSLWRTDPQAPLESLEFLLGLTDDLSKSLKTATYEDQTHYGTNFPALYSAAERIVRAHPRASVQLSPHLYLGWTSEKPTYGGLCNFQNAVWLLWLQKWRARVCKQCMSCFVAQKKHQLFCSEECSHESHKASARRWAEDHRAKLRKRNKPRSKPKGAAR